LKEESDKVALLSDQLSEGEKNREGERMDLAAYKSQIENVSENMKFLRDMMEKDRQKHLREKEAYVKDKKNLKETVSSQETILGQAQEEVRSDDNLWPNSLQKSTYRLVAYY